VLGHDLDAKRVDSLCDATSGVLHSAFLAVSAVGQGLAAARGMNLKHATRQVDRLLSNPGIDVGDMMIRRVPDVVGARSSIVVGLDWIDFDADGQATIRLSPITEHGRAAPLVWRTVGKRTRKDQRSRSAHRVLGWLAELLPADTKVCVVADRSAALRLCHPLSRQPRRHRQRRGNPHGCCLGQPGGRACLPCGAAATADCHAVGTVVSVQDPDIKQACCLPPAAPMPRPGNRPVAIAAAGAPRVVCATPRTCASAWGWGACTSNPPTGVIGGCRSAPLPWSARCRRRGVGL
jgi:hypothetical protein